jgi:hypothetical protein
VPRELAPFRVVVAAGGVVEGEPPGGVPPAAQRDLAAAAPCHVVVEEGRLELRWPELVIETARLEAGARLARALATPRSAYR